MFVVIFWGLLPSSTLQASQDPDPRTIRVKLGKCTTLNDNRYYKQITSSMKQITTLRDQLEDKLVLDTANSLIEEFQKYQEASSQFIQQMGGKMASTPSHQRQLSYPIALAFFVRLQNSEESAITEQCISHSQTFLSACTEDEELKPEEKERKECVRFMLASCYMRTSMKFEDFVNAANTFYDIGCNSQAYCAYSVAANMFPKNSEELNRQLMNQIDSKIKLLWKTLGENERKNSGAQLMRRESRLYTRLRVLEQSICNDHSQRATRSKLSHFTCEIAEHFLVCADSRRNEPILLYLSDLLSASYEFMFAARSSPFDEKKVELYAKARDAILRNK